MRILSSWRLCASFVSRPTESEPPDRRRCPAMSSASAGSLLSRWTSFCSCHLSHGLFSPHSFSRSRPLTLSRSSRGDTRSAPAVHRYALGSGGSRVQPGRFSAQAQFIPSFLPASLPACLPVCPPSSISPSLSLAPTLTFLLASSR